MKIKVVAWDFDGVLNDNIVDGRFIWADKFERDIGHPLDGFVTELFADNYDAIITGREDLRDRINLWAQKTGYRHAADRVLDYWFAQDQFLNQELLRAIETLSAEGIRHVMVTNNEAIRARFIEHELGFGERMERVFASGPMQLRKPDAAFFDAVVNALEIAPEDILLVDDMAENIAGARQQGWKVFHFTDSTRHQLPDVLEF